MGQQGFWNWLNLCGKNNVHKHAADMIWIVCSMFVISESGPAWPADWDYPNGMLLAHSGSGLYNMAYLRVDRNIMKTYVSVMWKGRTKYWNKSNRVLMTCAEKRKLLWGICNNLSRFCYILYLQLLRENGMLSVVWIINTPVHCWAKSLSEISDPVLICSLFPFEAIVKRLTWSGRSRVGERRTLHIQVASKCDGNGFLCSDRKTEKLENLVK